jgi:hypothetical protein
MSITLWYSCRMEMGRGPAYWWPLLCEVLRDHDFHFGDPALLGKRSSYWYHRSLPPYEGEQEEHDEAIGSFRDLWDEVYQEVGGVTVPFWWKDKDFSLDVLSVFPVSAQGLPQVGIDFTLTGGQIADATPEEARSMLSIVLLCFKDLYEQCDPITARVYWEDTTQDYAPWVLFGETPPDLHAPRNPSRPPMGVHPPEKYRLLKEPLTNGKMLFQFDPIPVPTRRNWEGDPYLVGWEWLSLLENNEDKIDTR